MTGTGSRVVYCWDTCVFLALLRQETDKDIANLLAVAAEIETGQADLIISTIVLAELLELIADNTLAEQFNGFCRRPNVMLANVDPRIARKAARLRWLAKAPDERNHIKKLHTPDAIILATAIIHEATALHTYDPDLLRFNVTDLANNIPILQPRMSSGQNVLGFT